MTSSTTSTSTGSTPCGILVKYLMEPVAIDPQREPQRTNLLKELVFWSTKPFYLQNGRYLSTVLSAIRDLAARAHFLPPVVRKSFLDVTPYVAYWGPLCNHTLPFIMSFMDFDCAVREVAQLKNLFPLEDWPIYPFPIIIVGPARVVGRPDDEIVWYGKKANGWGYEFPKSNKYVAELSKTEQFDPLQKRALLLSHNYMMKFIPKCENPRVDQTSTSRQSPTDSVISELLIGKRVISKGGENEEEDNGPFHFWEGLLPSEWFHQGSYSQTHKLLAWLRVTFLCNSELRSRAIIERTLEIKTAKARSKTNTPHARKRVREPEVLHSNPPSLDEPLSTELTYDSYNISEQEWSLLN